MRVGLVSPYPWDIPGGVVSHIRDLAERLIEMGHEVSVLSPVDDDDSELPDYVVAAGHPVAIPYNGSVARLLAGPVSAGRTRRWLRQGGFDVLHCHEPVAPSISLLACYWSTGPVVATFHTNNPRSRWLSAIEPIVVPALEKVRARIAVSEDARRTNVEHLGGDAVVIPNGVSVARFAAGAAASADRVGRTLLFLGRIDESRKGLDVLFEALALLPEHVRLLVAGPGEAEPPPALAHRVRMLGLVSEQEKVRLLCSADIYVAPNTGQESFGIVLLEAMAAGTPVVASDLDAFRSVLDDGRAGEQFAAGDPAALASTIAALLTDAPRRAALAEAGHRRAAQFDWATIAARVVEVYDTVLEGESLVADRA